MVNRFHVPVVVTAREDVTRGDVEGKMEEALEDVIEPEYIYRAYVEGSEMEEEQEELVLEILDSLDDVELIAAMQSIETISDTQDGGENDG
jgi:hypothetical protein